MVAVLACGDGALLSHRSAGALWGFCEEHPGYIEISVRRHCRVHRDGIRAHDRPGIWSRDITSRLGIPLTSPVKTFLDFASVTGPKTLERAINKADKLNVIDADSLRRALDDHPGEPGIRLLRLVLFEHTFRLSDDELERLFRPLAAAAGLPTPLTKVMVDKFEVDFFWPHPAPYGSGLTPLRFSHYQVKYEPRHVEDILRKTVSNLRGHPAPSPGK